MSKVKEKVELACRTCGKLFLSNGVQLYCRELSLAACEMCGKTFTRRCDQKPHRTCGKSCGSKLIRREQGERNQVPCQECGELFRAVITGACYCGRSKTRACDECGTSYQYKCQPPYSHYCSASCKFKTLRRKGYSISEERTCEYCGRSFKPTTSRQRFCGKDMKECAYCGELFPVSYLRWQAGTLSCCDNQCSTLLQMGSKVPRERVKEYKHLDEWAKRFKREHGRKPSLADFRMYFQAVFLPANTNRSLFKIRGVSGFERVAKDVLLSLGLEPLERVRLIKTPTGKLELDLFLPDLNLAFEVQDFASHSKTSNQEPSPFASTGQASHAKSKKFKCGPTYHARKRKLALEQLGVTVVEVWEDDFMEGRYRAIIEAAVLQARQSLVECIDTPQVVEE